MASEDPIPVAAEAVIVPTRGPSTSMRISVVVHGVLLPAILLWLSYRGEPVLVDQPWQSGEFQDYLAMLFEPRAWLVFGPAMLYAMISMTTWAIAPRTGRLFWIRAGVYTGVVISIQYFGLLLVFYHLAMLIDTVIVWLLWRLALWIARPFVRLRSQFHIWHILVLMTLAALLVVAGRLVGRSVLNSLFAYTLPILFAVPGTNVIAYVYAAYKLYRSTPNNSASKPWHWPVVFLGGLGLWLAAWRYSILVMLDEYSKLPTTNPNCYLANAAAHAHPWLTGATERGQITKCIQRLKFLELVLRAAAPRVHGQLRTKYDRYCPPLANYCRNHASLATVTCLALKPIELGAELIRWLLNIDSAAIERLYSPNTLHVK